MKDNIPNEIKDLLYDLAHCFKGLLEGNFVGFYTHGSIAMGCFNFQESDVDFLVVVKDSLNKQTKQEIIKLLLNRSKEAPPKGFEMSIIKQSELDNFKHPTPFELHYSNENICDDDDDPDLAAHLVITKQRGICLLGRKIDQVFPNIPKKYYLDSILQDSLDSLEPVLKGSEEGFCNVPTYAVLNLCRVLAFIKEEIILSKLEGGQWGLKILPQKYHNIIEQALNKYSSKPTKKVQASILKQFGVYGKSIFDELDKVF